MNCEQVDAALDAAAELDTAATGAVQRHLASCSDCREAWAAFRALAAERVPATPRDLAARVHIALAARAPAGVSRARVSLAIGAALVVGAAIAGAIAWHIARVSPPFAAAPRQATESAAPAEATPDVPPRQSIVPDEPADADSGAAVGASADEADAGRFAVDTRSVVVLVRPDPKADADVIAELERCRDAVIRELHAVGLNVIAGGPVTSLDAGARLSPWELARELGAATAVVLGVAERMASCQAEQVDARSGDVRWQRLVFLNSDLPRNAPWASFARGIAEDVSNSLRDRSTVLLEAQTTALDTSLPDRVRVSALMKLMSGLIPVPEAHDTAVVAAAFEIAAKSSDADARASAWLWIGRLGVEPPQVLPALLSALERDSADEVRSTAARVLADFLHEPGVAEALARAAAEDPQERPAAPCCLLTVREAARRALLADEEPRAAVRKILFDESLPPHDRLMLVAANGRFFSLRELGDDAAQAVFGIGANAADPDIRGTAWYWLRGAHSARFAPTLLDDLARHSSEQVRAQAAAALTSYSDDPAVSAALARALRDPAESVQRAAREALERTPP